MEKNGVDPMIIAWIIFNYIFFKYNNIKYWKSLFIILAFNIFCIVDITNNIYAFWDSFYIIKFIVILVIVACGSYISFKGLKNNSLSGWSKIYAYMGLFYLIAMAICVLIVASILGYMILTS